MYHLQTGRWAYLFLVSGWFPRLLCYVDCFPLECLLSYLACSPSVLIFPFVPLFCSPSCIPDFLCCVDCFLGECLLSWTPFSPCALIIFRTVFLVSYLPWSPFVLIFPFVPLSCSPSYLIYLVLIFSFTLLIYCPSHLAHVPTDFFCLAAWLISFSPHVGGANRATSYLLTYVKSAVFLLPSIGVLVMLRYCSGDRSFCAA